MSRPWGPTRDTEPCETATCCPHSGTGPSHSRPHHSVPRLGLISGTFSPFPGLSAFDLLTVFPECMSPPFPPEPPSPALVTGLVLVLFSCCGADLKTEATERPSAAVPCHSAAGFLLSDRAIALATTRCPSPGFQLHAEAMDSCLGRSPWVSCTGICPNGLRWPRAAPGRAAGDEGSGRPPCPLMACLSLALSWPRRQGEGVTGRGFGGSARSPAGPVLDASHRAGPRARPGWGPLLRPQGWPSGPTAGVSTGTCNDRRGTGQAAHAASPPAGVTVSGERTALPADTAGSADLPEPQQLGAGHHGEPRPSASPQEPRVAGQSSRARVRDEGVLSPSVGCNGRPTAPGSCTSV